MRIQILILGFKGLIVSAYKVTRLCATLVHTLRIVSGISVDIKFVNGHALKRVHTDFRSGKRIPAKAGSNGFHANMTVLNGISNTLNHIN